MKARVTRLDLKKDPTFDPEGLLDEMASHPYIIKTKKHWWNRWKYVMDYHIGCPRLFFDTVEVLSYLHDNQLKLI